jgi:hypothetical protein
MRRPSSRLPSPSIRPHVLLSFAQFEREVIGERVRDKIAASKRKGIWVGGPVPLGYAAVDKKAIVLPAQAKTVRAIFTRYLELGAVQALAEDPERSGVRTKQRKLRDGRIIGGVAFGGSWPLSISLHAPTQFFGEPGHESPPIIPALVQAGGFEVSRTHKVAIWHGGYAEAASRLGVIAPWLAGEAEDLVLAGTSSA